MTAKVKKPRPYWHVDAKWIIGILSILVLMVTFSIYLLMQLTTPKEGINLLATTMASVFSYEGGGLDESGNVENMKEKIAESADGSYQPIPGLDITVRMDDIEGKTPREARLWFFTQMAEPLYYDGQQGLIDKMTDPDMKDEVSGGVGPLALISAETHSKLKSGLLVFGVISLLLVVLLVIFSYRFGRFGSPGLVLFLAALPNLLLATVLQRLISNPTTSPGDEGIQTMVARYAQLAADVLPDVIQKAITLYLIIMVVGIVLMVMGLIGSIFFRKKKEVELEPAG
ncbi:hypothetical protein ACFLXB_08285 [Chloroflexota bacterium]